MNRRFALKSLAVLAGGIAVGSSVHGLAAPAASAGRLVKTAEQWRALLPANRYTILFEDGTEAPGSSPLNLEKRDGTFVCAACFLPLFDSAKKFESGTGWPSFWQPIRNALGTKSDHKLFTERTEYHCRRCGGHQGHVFDDGPRPTGLRHCNNGLALQFVPRATALPGLRT